MTQEGILFTHVSLADIRRSYPDFSGNPFVHELQVHLVDRVLLPLFDRYVPFGGIALDLGCGSGTLVRRLALRARVALGIDLDDSSFGKHSDVTVLERLEGLPERPGAYLVRGDLADLPLSDGSVDVVTSRWVFEHLEKPDRAIGEIERVLRPGGAAVIVVPNVRHAGIWLSRVLPLRAKQTMLHRLDGIGEDLVFPTYYRANTAGDLDRLFGEAGFEKRDLSYVQDPSYWMFSRTLFRFAAGIATVTRSLPLESRRMHIVAAYQKAGGEGSA